jgi:hypothetical protein
MGRLLFNQHDSAEQLDIMPHGVALISNQPKRSQHSLLPPLIRGMAKRYRYAIVVSPELAVQ